MNIINYIIIILISSCLLEYWAFLYDGQDIPEPFHLLYDRYSKHHNLLTKNGVPNTVSSTLDTLVANDVRYDLLTSSLIHLYSKMEDILHEYAHDLYLQHLLIFSHSHCCKFELLSHDSGIEYHPLKHDNDIWLSKQYEHSSYLQYENYFYFPYNKYRKFIETKSSRNKIAGF